MVSGGNTADLCSPTESSSRAGTWDVWASGKEGPSKRKERPSSGERRAHWGAKPLTSPSSVSSMGRAIPHGARGRNRPSKDKGTLTVAL